MNSLFLHITKVSAKKCIVGGSLLDQTIEVYIVRIDRSDLNQGGGAPEHSRSRELT